MPNKLSGSKILTVSIEKHIPNMATRIPHRLFLNLCRQTVTIGQVAEQ